MDARERIREIVERVAVSEGLEVVDVELAGRGNGTVVRIFIDKPPEGPVGERPAGVSLTDCALISREVGVLLDIEVVFNHRYTLEVSSPGLDRKLVNSSHYQRFAGKNIKLSLKIPRGQDRHFRGELLGLEDGKVVLRTEQGEKIPFALEEIAQANLIPEIGKIPKLGPKPGSKSGRQPEPKPGSGR